MLPRAGGLNGRRGRKRPRSGPVPLGCYVSRHSPAPSPAPGTPRTYGGNKRTPLPATPIMQRTLAATPSSAVATPAAAKAAAAAAAATATIANTSTKKQHQQQEAQPPGVLGLQGTSLASSPHSGRGEFAPLCPACQNPNRDIITDQHAGDVVCRDCGMVIGHHVIDETQEWRTFADDTRRNVVDPTRVGGPDVLGLPVTAELREASCSKSSKHSNSANLARSAHRLTDRSQRDMQDWFDRITNLADRMHLPNRAQHRAMNLFKTAREKGLITRAATLQVAVPTVVYAACRLEGITRAIREVCRASQKTVKEVGRCFVMLKRELGLETSTVSTKDYVARVCNSMGMSHPEAQATRRVVERAKQLAICLSRRPLVLVGAVAYMVSRYNKGLKDRITFAKVAVATHVADTTLRVTYKELVQHTHALLPAMRNTAAGSSKSSGGAAGAGAGANAGRGRAGPPSAASRSAAHAAAMLTVGQQAVDSSADDDNMFSLVALAPTPVAAATAQAVGAAQPPGLDFYRTPAASKEEAACNPGGSPHGHVPSGSVSDGDAGGSDDSSASVASEEDATEPARQPPPPLNGEDSAQEDGRSDVSAASTVDTRAAHDEDEEEAEEDTSRPLKRQRPPRFHRRRRSNSVPGGCDGDDGAVVSTTTITTTGSKSTV